MKAIYLKPVLQVENIESKNIINNEGLSGAIGGLDVQGTAGWDVDGSSWNNL